MNFTERMQEEEGGFPLAPMIDIVFLLLIFFMTTSVFARLENEMSVTVPKADSAEPSQRQVGELIVNLQEDGSLIVNQQEVNVEKLRTMLERIAENFPNQSVIIRGDRRSQLEDAIQILDTCAKAGVWNVSFAALPPDGQSSQPLRGG